MVAHIYNPSIQETEAEGSPVQGKPVLNTEIEARLHYIARPCQKTTQK